MRSVACCVSCVVRVVCGTGVRVSARVVVRVGVREGARGKSGTLCVGLKGVNNIECIHTYGTLSVKRCGCVVTPRGAKSKVCVLANQGVK